MIRVGEGQHSEFFCVFCCSYLPSHSFILLSLVFKGNKWAKESTFVERDAGHRAVPRVHQRPHVYTQWLAWVSNKRHEVPSMYHMPSVESRALRSKVTLVITLLTLAAGA